MSEEEPTEELENPFDVGYEGDGRVLKPGATYGSGKFEVVRPEKKLNISSPNRVLGVGLPFSWVFTWLKDHSNCSMVIA